MVFIEGPYCFSEFGRVNKHYNKIAQRKEVKISDSTLLYPYFIQKMEYLTQKIKIFKELVLHIWFQ